MFLHKWTAAFQGTSFAFIKLVDPIRKSRTPLGP